MRRNRLAILIAIVAGLLVVVTGCTKSGGDDSTSATPPTLPFSDSPSEAKLSSATGLVFPSSVTNYRSVRLDSGQLDVTFDVPAGDVDSMVSRSKLPALADKRVIAHPSPLWDLNPAGAVRATSDVRNRTEIGLESVAGDPSVIRLTLLATPKR